MNNDEKEKFISDLVASVLSGITKDIHNGASRKNGTELNFVDFSLFASPMSVCQWRRNERRSSCAHFR